MIDWFGSESAVAGKHITTSHVGGLTACINYGFTTASPLLVHVYSDHPDLYEGENVRVLIRHKPLSNIVQAECDDTIISAADECRAIVEALVDLDGVDMDIVKEIVTSSKAEGIELEELQGIAETLGVLATFNSRYASA